MTVREPRDRGAEVGGRVVPEFLDAWMALERGLNDPALHAAAPPVNQPHFPQPGLRGRIDIVCDDVRNITRGERMKIELAFERDVQGVICHCGCRSAFGFRR